MKKMKIRRDDEVVVIAGRSKGKRGKVMKVLSSAQRLFVKSVNIVRYHQKASQGASGGILEKEASIHVSNVSLIDPETLKPTRIGFKFTDDGEKVRFSKRSGQVLES